MTEYRITVPIKDEDIKKLNIRDIVYVAGTVYVARDRTHERLMEYARKGEKSPINLGGAVIYHAGPIVRKKNGEWKVIVAGPTTSTRMNKITSQILEKYPIRMIIGKGGMNSEVAEAMKKYIAIYCHYTGGAAVLATKNIKKVMSVEWLDLGMPEALWILKVGNFGPSIATIDANENSLYEKLSQEWEANVEKLIDSIT